MLVVGGEGPKGVAHNAQVAQHCTAVTGKPAMEVEISLQNSSRSNAKLILYTFIGGMITGISMTFAFFIPLIAMHVHDYKFLAILLFVLLGLLIGLRTLYDVHIRI